MPPRKSNISVVSNGEEGTDALPSKIVKDGVNVEDLSLPKSMVARLAKGVLPANTQIHKDALLALHKSATVFVNYIASNSNENAQAAGKKTILPQDVMAALKDTEFEAFIPKLEAELKKYNDTQCDKRNTYRRRVKEEKAASAPNEDGDAAADAVPSVITLNGTGAAVINGHEENGEGERPVKKLKGEAGLPVVADAEAGDDETFDDAQDNDDQAGDDEDDEVEDDEVEDDVQDDDGQDETMDDAAERLDEQPGGMRDEALDDPDSD